MLESCQNKDHISLDRILCLGSHNYMDLSKIWTKRYEQDNYIFYNDKLCYLYSKYHFFTILHK